MTATDCRSSLQPSQKPRPATNSGKETVKPQRPIAKSIRNPTLFEMEKLEKAAELAGELKIERPYSLPGILLGTSAFTANGWLGSFYPAGMKPADYLKFYSTRFQTVEVDSTFYGTPSAATVEKWYEKTPPDFIFAAKIPQVITHDKVLVDCDSEFEEFVKTMDILEKAACRSQVCNRNSKQDLARRQIRGRAPAAQRCFGIDRYIVYAETLGNEGEV